MNFHIITIFPKIFDSYFNESIIGRSQKESIIKINLYDLRDYTTDKHKTVDDTPYGGGAGMVMKIEPIYKALKHITENMKHGTYKKIMLSAKGKKWNQQTAQSYPNKYSDIILLCGRYEGVDERVLELVDEEISIGDYVLTGGEIGAMTIVDSITRLLPGALGNTESAIDESHSKPNELEYPQYTRPEIFKINNKEFKVPTILLSGNHKLISEWREKNKKLIKEI